MVLDNVKECALRIAQMEVNWRDTDDVVKALGILFTKLSEIKYAYELTKWYVSDDDTAIEYRALVNKLEKSKNGREIAERLTWCARFAPQFYNED